MAINDILRELGNKVNRSLFGDDLVIYFATRNQKVATRALQRATNKLDAWTVEGGVIYTGAFGASPVESLHTEAYYSPLKLRKNEL